MQTEISQVGTNPYLMMLYGALIASAPVLITLAWKYYSRRKADRRLDSTAISQIELKKIEVAVLQNHEKRDDLKAAQEEADLWQAKYYTLFVEAKENELTLRLENGQLKEMVANLQMRLRLYEQNTTDDTPRP